MYMKIAGDKYVCMCQLFCHLSEGGDGSKIYLVRLEWEGCKIKILVTQKEVYATLHLIINASSLYFILL